MAEIDDFYRLLEELSERCGGARTFTDGDAGVAWPDRGVYFFLEAGEVRPNGERRVVRVGTHALLRGSATTLWERLVDHRGTIGGARPGGGNHRGSLLRLHVGSSLIARDGDRHGAYSTWGSHRRCAAPATRNQEYEHERLVSEYVRRMPFLWLAVDDEPGPDSDRAVIEAGAIALLSARCDPVADEPSEGWLGRWCPNEAVRDSGLWNVRHTEGPPQDFLETMERHLLAMQAPARTGSFFGVSSLG